MDAGVSYDDRVARRKEEIESLQEALRILNGRRRMCFWQFLVVWVAFQVVLGGEVFCGFWGAHQRSTPEDLQRRALNICNTSTMQRGIALDSQDQPKSEDPLAPQ